MITFPNCKINLGLKVLGKRPDGFHDIESVFYPVPIRDALEVIHTHKSIDTLKFSSSGYQISSSEDNLCIKAYKLITANFGSLPSFQMHLHKAIPIGAGLGGGSANAAFTLKLLNQDLALNLSTEKLLEYAMLLGSDVPFFILNKPCFTKGRGEILHPIPLDLSGFKIIVVYPGIHISTAWAFSQLSLTGTISLINTFPISEIVKQPPANWNQHLTNDFEPIVFNQYPEIKEIKRTLSEAGATYCSMSGSGSTVYALFQKDETISFDFPSSYLVKSFIL